MDRIMVVRNIGMALFAAVLFAVAWVSESKGERTSVKADAAGQLGTPWTTGSIHDLRKSYGTHAARHVSMADLRALMGHASITTTADYYVGVDQDLGERVRAAFA